MRSLEAATRVAGSGSFALTTLLMTPLLPSLLVLAWDDADPSAWLPGSAAHAPVLSVVRALATGQPLLAVLPQLPEGLRTEARLAEAEQLAAALLAGPAAGSAESREPAAAVPAASPTASLLALAPAGLATEVLNGAELAELMLPPLPLEQVLLPAGRNQTRGSRLVGLGELPPPPAAHSPAQLRPALASLLWTPRRGAWQAPAAPYLGSEAPPVAEPARPATTALPKDLPAPALAPGPAESTAPAPAAPAPAPAPHRSHDPMAPYLHAHLIAPDLNFEPDPELPAFDEADDFAEPGLAEAAALYAAEDGIIQPPLVPVAASPPLPSTPERASFAEALGALRRPGPMAVTAATAASPALTADHSAAPTLADDLQYRIIQYARFATHLAADQGEEFGVIYAPSWPTWLAALEIRYRLQRPLVLHLSRLAISTVPPAERGWLLELERYALRRAHTVLVADEALRGQVMAHYHLAFDRVRVVKPGDENGIRTALAEVSKMGSLK
jgi:hypothetical protein